MGSAVLLDDFNDQHDGSSDDRKNHNAHGVIQRRLVFDEGGFVCIHGRILSPMGGNPD
jgi:hypothetical protein